MKWFVDFILTIILMTICFYVGKVAGRTDLIKEVQASSNICTTICAEEFEKWSC